MLQFRRGTCSSCGAMYKLPAEFPSDKAKCKECGGVVGLGPVETKKERPAAAQRPRPVPAKPAAKAAKPARPAAKTAARKPVAAAAGAASREGGRAERPARQRSGSSRGRGRSSARSRDKAQQSDEPEHKYGRRHNKKHHWFMVLGAIVAVAAFGAGSMWWVDKNTAGTQAAEGNEEATAKASQDASQTPPDAPAEAPDAADTAGTEAAADGPDADAPVETADADSEPAADAADAEGSSEETAAADEPEKPKKVADPSSVDLTVWADWGPVAGTSEEEWAELTEAMQTFADPYAPGRKFNKARDQLIAASRKAMPAILNVYKTIDVSTPEGRKMGDQIQRELLQKITNGRNFDWKYDETPESQLFNKKVINLWCKSWDDVKESDVGWSNLSKIPLEEVQKESGNAPAKVVDDLDDF